MRVIIVDDESLARARLRRLLGEFSGYELVGEAADAESALALSAREVPDLVLLDIRMAGMDGINLARRLAQYDPPPAVIFTTAYPEHALSAFDTHAQGYLLKPVRREKLAEALKRARRPSRATQPGDASVRPRRAFVLASTREGMQRVPAEDILYFLADQKYVTVRHLHGQVLIEESLNSLAQDFAPWFLRVHRKALVATRYIQELTRGVPGEEEHWLRMRHVSELIPVSRRRLSELRRYLARGRGG